MRADHALSVSCATFVVLGFPVVSSFECRAAAARLVGDDHRKPLVAGARPDGRLAVPRVAHHDRLRGIDLGQRDEPVEDSRELPGPGGDRTRLIGPCRGACSWSEVCQRALLAAVGTIRKDVAVAGRGHAIPAIEQSLDGPVLRILGSRGFGGPVADDLTPFVVRQPGFAHPDAGVGMLGLIALEVEMQEYGHRPVALWQVDEHIGRDGLRCVAEPQSGLESGGLDAVGHRRLVAIDVADHAHRHHGQAAAVDVCFKERELVRPPRCPPGIGRRHGLAVGAGEHVGECVGPDRRLVVVGLLGGVDHRHRDGPAEDRPHGMASSRHCNPPFRSSVVSPCHQSVGLTML